MMDIKYTQLVIIVNDYSNKTRDKDKESLYYKVNLCTANVSFTAT